MNRRITFTVLFFLYVALSAGTARADINIFLGDLNRQASANRSEYSYRLSNQFGVPAYQVDSLLKRTHSPADAFMCLQLGRMLNIPHERVLEMYQANRGKGWGVTAQRLGIKPGSPEFHALKKGNFSLTGMPDSTHGKYGAGFESEHGKGKQKGKDHGIGWGQGKDPDSVYPINEEIEPGKGKGKGKGHNK